MPIYEYEREDGSTFEYHQSMKDQALAECPTTGQKVRRIITGGQINPHLKGGGWTGKDISREEFHRRNLAKDPFYTTLSDHKKIIEDRTKKREAVFKPPKQNFTEL